MKQQIIDVSQIQPSHSDLRVIGVFNPAVAKYRDHIVMIARVAEAAIQDEAGVFKVPTYSQEGGFLMRRIPRNDPHYDFSDVRVVKNGKSSFLTSISHLRVGKSRDGVHFDFADSIPLFPNNLYEEYGIEDPRITKIGETYFVTYAAVSRHGITVRLLETTDFETFREKGNIFHSDNKDCVLFPGKIQDKYYCLHRPSFSQFGRPDIWTAESTNLSDWGNHKILCEARVSYANSTRVGAGAPPFLSKEGWIEIYHSADESNRYHLAALLLDKDDPNKVLKRSKRPLVEPTEPFEQKGFMNDVVFTCGLIEEEAGIQIYYGACDESIGRCFVTYSDLFDNLEAVA